MSEPVTDRVRSADWLDGYHAGRAATDRDQQHPPRCKAPGCTRFVLIHPDSGLCREHQNKGTP